MLDVDDERQIFGNLIFFSLHMEITLWHCGGSSPYEENKTSQLMLCCSMALVLKVLSSCVDAVRVHMAENRKHS